jgi:hypothetical protein
MRANSTNEARIKFLTLQIKTLGEQIQRDHRQEDYISFVRGILADPRAFTPITDDEWDVMLPLERTAKLLAYYHCLRLELSGLQREMTKVGPGQRILDWLEQPYIKLAIRFSEISATTIALIEAGHHAGLYAREDKPDDLGR